jgi:hypothetical protein
MDLICLKTKGYQYQRYVNSFYNADNENVLYVVSHTFTSISNEKMYYLMYLSEWGINRSIPYKYIIFYGSLYGGRFYGDCIHGRNDIQYRIVTIYIYDKCYDCHSNYVIKYYNECIFSILYKDRDILINFDLYGNMLYCSSQNIKYIQEMKNELKTSKIDFPKDIYI